MRIGPPLTKCQVLYYLNDGTCVWFILSPPAFDPYTLDLVNDEFWILSDEEPLEEVHFSKKPEYYDKMTTSGVPMQKVANLGGPDLFYFCQSRHCHFWEEFGGHNIDFPERG